MKEDILEQIVDDWFLSQDSTFTKHNVKFRPDKNDPDFSLRQDSSHSDIDVLGIHLNKYGIERVSAATCKSWQSGFNPEIIMKMLLETPEKRLGVGPVWKKFRELVKPKWGRAFSGKIYEETLSKEYIYYIVVTKFNGNNIEKAIQEFEQCEEFLSNLRCDGEYTTKIKLISFKDIFTEHYIRKSATTLEATELGRLLQIIRASGIKFEL